MLVAAAPGAITGNVFAVLADYRSRRVIATGGAFGFAAALAGFALAPTWLGLVAASFALGGLRAASWALGVPVHQANLLIGVQAVVGLASVLWRRRARVTV